MKMRMRDGTGWRKYKYVVEEADWHGNVRIYFRRKGRPKTRLIEIPGTREFDEEYQRVFRGDLVVARGPRSGAAALATPGSTRWACEQYYVSAAFQQLDNGTRIVRRRILDKICERVGNGPLNSWEPRHVAKLRDEKAATPEAANSYVKVLRQLFAWAMLPEYAYAKKNPAREVAYLQSNNPDGHRVWSEDDVAKFETRHPIGTKARLALDLFLYTGARISDVAKFGPQMERWFSQADDAGNEIRIQKLVFTEFKGRRRIKKSHELPILTPMRASIDATPVGHLVYLVTQAGHPHSVKGLGNWFARQCRIAGLEKGLSPHGLRKTGAVRCVEAGATEHQLMALFGWSTTKQVALYTRKANRTRLEAEAAPLLQGQTGNKNVPPFWPMRSSETFRRKSS